MRLELDFAARSEVGMVRKGNEDSGYAGPHLLLIADGMGGHAFGEVASAAAIGVLATMEPAAGTEPPDPEDLLRAGIARAGARLRRMIADKPDLEGMGTTVTALLQVGERVALAQVGDSRGYLLRDGVLEQVTHDQTFVQSLIDEGRISQEEARVHPQRSLLLQALDGRAEVEPVLGIRTPVVGDRYLLCSDGLPLVLAEATMREVLMVGTPADAVDRLVELALRGGAPDNVTCVVADVVDLDVAAGEPGGDPTDEPAAPASGPVVVGAAAELAEDASVGGSGTATDGHGAQGAGVGSGELTGPDVSPEQRPRHGRTFRLILPLVLFLALVATGGYLGYRWTQQQYYVGAAAGQVAIYRGVPQHLAGHALSTVVDSSSGMALADLPTYARNEVLATISASSLSRARAIVDRLRLQAATCSQVPVPDGCPAAVSPTQAPAPTSTASSTATGTGTGTPSPSPSVAKP